MNIVVTGASRGIGRAICLLFAEKGFSVAACSRNEENLRQLKDDIIERNHSVDVFVRQCDVSKKEDVLQFGKFCIDTLQDIDILVNNAGIFLPGNIFDEEEGTFEKLMATNLYSAYYITRFLTPYMIKRKKGHIFNMCSVASINAYDKGGSYAISKFGLLGFSKNLRHELKSYGIRVTAVIAGATLTDSWAGSGLPEERFIKDEDIAKLVWNAWEMSERADVEEILVRPMLGDI